MLRSSIELSRYDVEASDGRIGRTSDLLVDATTWTVSALVVDTGGLLTHDHVLIKPQSIRELRFPDEVLVLAQARSEVASVSDATQAETSAPCARGMHSTEALLGLQVLATDTDAGTLGGLLIETESWSVRYLIVDTGLWLGGKQVLLSPRSVRSIDEEEGRVVVDVSDTDIAGGPEYDSRAELTRECEAFLHDYYGWPPYWE